MRKVYDDGNVTLYQGDNMACADLWNVEGGSWSLILPTG